MKARVSGTPAGRDAVDKTKGKEMHELISVSLDAICEGKHIFSTYAYGIWSDDRAEVSDYGRR